MLATHVYMHRSPRCSVEIEIEVEKELEKGRKWKEESSPSLPNSGLARATVPLPPLSLGDR